MLNTASSSPSYDAFFQREGVNPFVDTAHNTICRFAVDAGTASYIAAQRLVMDGHLPDPDSVRVEEFINYFGQGFEPPAEDAFAIHIEGAPSPFGRENQWLIRVGLQGRVTEAEERQVIARSVEAWLKFNPKVVSSYRQLGYEYRRVSYDDILISTMVAGEVAAGHSVAALYEVEFHQGAEGHAATAHIRYEDPDTGDVRETSREFYKSEFSTALEEASPRFLRDAAVAEYAEVLRGSYWARGSRLETVRRLAQRVSRLLPDDPDVAEFVDLVTQAERIAPGDIS